VSKSIAEKALRYDLTVPFARFVVMNQHSIAFPFKRYQIQPVWRADRPQKGRYREFYQCDADVVGSDSLLNEVELVQIFDDALTMLRVPSFIKINNRKILQGIAELAGVAERMMEMTIAIDKLDKVGEEGVVKELTERGFSASSIQTIRGLFALSGSNEERLTTLEGLLAQSEAGMKGISELRYVMARVNDVGLKTALVELDVTLARGLNYYTGAIFEVKAVGVQMGSICGGGRYDDLTGIFGLKGVSGVGISFGADRIYDVMTELNVFPADAMQSSKVLFANFGEKEEMYCMKLLRLLRDAGINAEIYPENAKMKKQFKYADDKRIPFVAIVGEEEIKNSVVYHK
jgi:histidyl-tRNA synthetase